MRVIIRLARTEARLSVVHRLNCRLGMQWTTAQDTDEYRYRRELVHDQDLFLANSSMRARSLVRTFLKFAGCPEATGPDRSEIEVFGVTSRYQGVVIVWHAIDRAR
jgi:hypothetical protein